MKPYARRSRGQSALEYLVTYGWAILAIVIVAAVLWYLGIFNPEQWSGQRKCPSFPSMTCLDFSLPSGTIGAATNGTLFLGNAVGGNIIAPGPLQLCSTGPIEGGNTTVAPNGNFTCLFTYLTGPLGTSSDNIPVTIGYITSRSGIRHNDTGVIKGKFE